MEYNCAAKAGPDVALLGDEGGRGMVSNATIDGDPPFDPLEARGMSVSEVSKTEVKGMSNAEAVRFWIR